jgi:hypothetical protein
LKVDIAAVKDFMEDMTRILEGMNKRRDEGSNASSSCRSLYSRLHSELEHAIRDAKSRIDDADSKMDQADEDYETAERYMNEIDNPEAQKKARDLIERAHRLTEEAQQEKETAEEELAKASANMNKLSEVWESYSQKMENASRTVEVSYSDFLVTNSAAKTDLESFIVGVGNVQAALYGEYPAPGTGNSALQGGSSVSTDGTASGTGGKSGKSQTNRSSGFVSGSGNSIGLAEGRGRGRISMNIGGNTESYPNSKSGAAKAYRAAVSSGDQELASKAKEIFEAGGILSEPVIDMPASGANGAVLGKYVRTVYSDVISGKEIRREVYRNTEIDPDIIVPKGTHIGNGKYLECDKTNLELMRNGNAPFVLTDKGELSQINLHHLSGIETVHGEAFFNSAYPQGGMAEVAGKKHQSDYKILHIPKDKNSSFRVDVRTGGRSPDAAQYDKFRERYWQTRAKEIDDARARGIL